MIEWGSHEWPSAEDEFFASLEPPEQSYEPELMLALSGLTEKQRFVVECRYGIRGDHEMTVCEIATLMGVSHQAIVRLLQRSMKRLYKGLQESTLL